MADMPILKDPNLRAKVADLAPRMASYWTLEADAGVEGAKVLADEWTRLAFELRAEVVEQRRQADFQQLVLDVRRAQGRLPDGSVR